MSRATLFIVSAPSGAGKTSLVNALVASTPGVVLSVSHTTRPRRTGEVDGRDYHFVDAATFEAMVAGGEFIEHAAVFGNLYGTSRAGVEAQLAAGQDVILEIDWQGARQVREYFADAVSVFIIPPSREALEQRLLGRGQDSAATVRERMAGAVAELSHYDESDYLVVNDDFEQALGDLAAIVRAERQRLVRARARHGALVQTLLNIPAR